MKLKGTKTAENLMKAFAGESQATRRYNFYGKVARKANLVQIANIFDETAMQEAQHAKEFYKFLNSDPELVGSAIEINAGYPVGLFENTVDNLRAAAAGENEEWTTLYPEFAATAREEGFLQIAKKFEAIALVEKRHDEQYSKLAKNIDDHLVFAKEDEVMWVCLKCGHVHVGKEAPKACPICLHDQGYFEILATNF